MGRFIQWLRYGRLIRSLGLPPFYSRQANRAEKTLIQIGEPAIEALGRAATRSKRTDARARAVRALDEIGGATTVPALIQALRDPEESVATNAVKGLKKFETAQVTDALAVALGNRAAADAAAEELARRNDARCLDRLIASGEVRTLQSFLTRNAQKASDDQLRRCMNKHGRTRYIEEDIPGSDINDYMMSGQSTYRVIPETESTGWLQTLAREELTRRGLKE